MKDTVTDERMAALFVLGWLGFNPPLLTAFDGNAMVFGVPVLYVSLFAGWLLLIVLLALAIESRDSHADGDPVVAAAVDDPHDTI
ncbi:MAG: hypothetical protein H7840_01150 [Alphaproteobacteria bacterium]